MNQGMEHDTSFHWNGLKELTLLLIQFGLTAYYINNLRSLTKGVECGWPLKTYTLKSEVKYRTPAHCPENLTFQKELVRGEYQPRSCTKCILTVY